VNFIKKKGDWHLFSNKTGLSREKALELLTLAGNMLVDENAYNEYTNSTKYIGVDFLTKDVENAMNYLKTNSQGKTFLDMPTQQRQEYFTSQEYMYKNSEWNPNIKEFYYVPTYKTQSNEILANQITQQTWYERQKGAEERFDFIATGTGTLSTIGKRLDVDKIPIGKVIIKGLDITSYSSIVMKFAVSPNKLNDYDLLNEILPLNFYMETAE
jgi:hypothetical protein